MLSTSSTEKVRASGQLPDRQFRGCGQRGGYSAGGVGRPAVSSIRGARSMSATQAPSERPPSATRLSLSHITAQNETNLLGTVHGGVVMTLVDSVAGVVAARHSGGAAVTASMDEMVFVVPVRVGDVLHFTA